MEATATKVFVKLDPTGPVYNYLTEVRRLSPAILAQYRVGEHRDQAAMCFAQLADSGKAVAFAKYVAVQRQPDGSKREWSDPKGANPGVWGKHAVSEDADELVICEGEIDAMSAAEAGFSAVSMPNGAGNVKWIERDYPWLLQFGSIILCFDADQAGRTDWRRLSQCSSNAWGLTAAAALGWARIMCMRTQFFAATYSKKKDAGEFESHDLHPGGQVASKLAVIRDRFGNTVNLRLFGCRSELISRRSTVAGNTV